MWALYLLATSPDFYPLVELLCNFVDILQVKSWHFKSEIQVFLAYGSFTNADFGVFNHGRCSIRAHFWSRFLPVDFRRIFISQGRWRRFFYISVTGVKTERKERKCQNNPSCLFSNLKWFSLLIRYLIRHWNRNQNPYQDFDFLLGFFKEIFENLTNLDIFNISTLLKSSLLCSKLVKTISDHWIITFSKFWQILLLFNVRHVLEFL